MTRHVTAAHDRHAAPGAVNEQLPPELIAQLGKRTQSTAFDAQILALFGDGPLTHNDVLIGLWRQDGSVRKRATMMSKLYRMALAGKLVAVPGVRGCYRLPIVESRA